MEIFLLLLALVWLIIASIQDIKKREVPNWLSFSLITFALAYRIFFSVFNADLWFFLFGLIGFVCFFVLAYLFYYARIFAGGDAKLLMGLGVLLPSSRFMFENLFLLSVFILLLLVIGSLYGLVYSSVLISLNFKNFVKGFSKQMRKRKGLVFFSLIPAILSFVLVLYSRQNIFFLFPLIILVFPFLYVYSKAVEESCMIKEISGKNLTVGDWLYETVRVGKRKIKPYWEGLSEEEVKLLRKVKKVKIKQGIPFVPSFLFSFIIFILLKDYFLNLLLI